MPSPLGVAGREVGERLRRDGPSCWPGYKRHWPDDSGRCLRCKNVVRKQGSKEDMMAKLSDTQQRTLRKLDSSWKCAYELGESLGTLNALVRKGLVESKGDLGALFFPRTSIDFRPSAMTIPSPAEGAAWPATS